ncbi:hypothetical protein AAG570_009442 [Ranatra chinensis]|uniref:Uncharacterized protein n=1 Tax=Ranatra chinensis TaxID=642074 RepID=A0ABD0YP32_9HEMI
MIQFSWILLRLYDKESEMMRERYLERMLQQAQAAKEAMKGAKQELWKCDPKKHKEGETYTELTKILQGFIVNEVDLNDQMTCKEDCGAYSITKQHGCYKDGYCKKQQACRGTVVDCKYVDSDMWVCPSDANKRRYDWIEYENGHTLGMKKSCSRAITKVDSWWRWVFWHCSYCFCLCDDQHNSNSDRYFNLRPITSNILQNKVVSGIRFVKVNQVIHLQIQEADMSAKGSLNGTSVAWKPVDAYFIKQAKEGQDYHTITYKERAIDLDDLFVPDGHVLTGVRFRKVGTHLNFEIQASPYNYTSGILSRDRSQWISNDNTDGSLVKPRKKLVLDSPDLPTRSSALAEPDSSSDQYLEFTNSDIDSDAAQSTVPFIDIQPVAPKPPVPLSGAGIYHKGNRWFGGFIAPKVFTLDFSAHLQDNFPEINEAQKLRK